VEHRRVDRLLQAEPLDEPQGPWSLGRVSAAGRDREGLLYAAANPRGMQGYAVGR